MRYIEKADIDSVIKGMQGNFGGDNASQMKGLQLLKGLATSDDPKANAFMKKLNASMTAISKEVLGGKKTESVGVNEYSKFILESRLKGYMNVFKVSLGEDIVNTLGVLIDNKDINVDMSVSLLNGLARDCVEGVKLINKEYNNLGLTEKKDNPFEFKDMKVKELVTLMQKDYGRSNKGQLRGTRVLSALANSEEGLSNTVMKEINKAMTEISVNNTGGTKKKKESIKESAKLCEDNFPMHWVGDIAEDCDWSMDGAFGCALFILEKAGFKVALQKVWLACNEGESVEQAISIAKENFPKAFKDCTELADVFRSKGRDIALEFVADLFADINFHTEAKAVRALIESKNLKVTTKVAIGEDVLEVGDMVLVVEATTKGAILVTEDILCAEAESVIETGDYIKYSKI